MQLSTRWRLSPKCTSALTNLFCRATVDAVILPPAAGRESGFRRFSWPPAFAGVNFSTQQICLVGALGLQKMRRLGGIGLIFRAIPSVTFRYRLGALSRWRCIADSGLGCKCLDGTARYERRGVGGRVLVIGPFSHGGRYQKGFKRGGSDSSAVKLADKGLFAG